MKNKQTMIARAKPSNPKKHFCIKKNPIGMKNNPRNGRGPIGTYEFELQASLVKRLEEVRDEIEKHQKEIDCIYYENLDELVNAALWKWILYWEGKEEMLSDS